MKRSNVGFQGLFLALLVVGVGCTNSDDTTTTTPTFAVDGKSYIEKYTCNEVFPPSPTLTCPDLAVQDTIQLTLITGNQYEGRDVPDTGYVYNGTFSGQVFTWTAVDPINSYTESGVWTFDAAGNFFTGSSTYTANDGSFTGNCNETGALAPIVPSDPPLVSGCP